MNDSIRNYRNIPEELRVIHTKLLLSQLLIALENQLNTILKDFTLALVLHKAYKSKINSSFRMCYFLVHHYKFVHIFILLSNTCINIGVFAIKIFLI